MVDRRRGWWSLVLACALVVTTQTGCLQILQARSRAEREQKEKAEKAVFEAYFAEFKTAFDARRWATAAAVFTLEREKQLIRYGAWHGNMRKLWYALRSEAQSAAGRRAYDEAVKLTEVMDAVPAALPKGLREEIDRDKSNWVEQRARVEASWNQALEPARADEQAGRKALAAARYAAMAGPPTAAAQQAVDAKICELALAVAAPYRSRVYVEKGKVAGGPGQAELADALERGARTAIYGPAVEIVTDAAAADIAIRFDLGAETFEHTTARETRTGRYVSGTKVVPNPKIPELQKDIAHWQKETKWKENAAASIRCSGSGPCKSRIAHLNDAKKYRERVAGLQQKLAREPATTKQPVYTEVSYDVTIHTWKLAQPIALTIRTKDGKTTRSTMVPDRSTSLLEQDAHAQLGLPAVKPTPQTADPLRAPMHKAMASSAEYLVHNNLGPRNDAIVAKVKATEGLERADWIATYLVVNPKANADNRSFADKEIYAITKVLMAGSKLADKGAACWKKP